MRQTKNLKLNLPDETDVVDINVLNENFQKIDENYESGGGGNSGGGISEAQVDEKILTAKKELIGTADDLATANTINGAKNYVKKEVDGLRQNTTTKTSQLDKRITNLEQGIVPSPFEKDDTVAYSKIVPENALPYAEIAKIGGTARKCTNLIHYPYIDTTKTIGGVTFTDNGDGTVTANGTYDSESNSVDFVLTRNLRLPVGSYTVKGIDSESGTTYRVLVTVKHTDGTKDYYSANTFNMLSGDIIESIIIRVFKAVGTLSDVVFKPMLNEGTTALPYAPYVKHTLPIPADVQALDGYGLGVNDTCYNYIDWEKKQFVKRVKKVDAGTLNWQAISNINYPNRFSTTIADMHTTNGNHIMEGYTSKGVTGYGSGLNADKTFSNASNQLYVHDSNYTDAATFKSAMQGVMLYYELAEPIIIDISDILSNDNYIEVESGGIVTMVNEFEYAVPSELIYQIKGDA